MSRSLLTSEAGFTLVELIVTTVFVAIASTAIVEIFITINKLNEQAGKLQTATALADQEIEQYRNVGYTALPTGTPAVTFTNLLPANFGSSKSAVINVTTPQTGLKQMDVVIKYTDDDVPKTVELSTLIAQTGIDR